MKTEKKAMRKVITSLEDDLNPNKQRERIHIDLHSLKSSRTSEADLNKIIHDDSSLLPEGSLPETHERKPIDEPHQSDEAIKWPEALHIKENSLNHTGKA